MNFFDDDAGFSGYKLLKPKPQEVMQVSWVELFQTNIVRSSRLNLNVRGCGG